MASISLFLKLIVVLSLFGVIHCETFVGQGKHILDGGKITTLNGIIAESSDIQRYNNIPNSCDVTIDNEGNINLLILKNSKTKRDGCSIDFVTKKEGQISLEFGIVGNTLMQCIKEVHHDDDQALRSIPMYNVLSFAYNLKGGEFEQLKNGPKEGHDNDCSNKGKCEINIGKCQSNPIFYIQGWKWRSYFGKHHFYYFINPVGDGYNDDYGKVGSSVPERTASFKLLIKGETLTMNGAKKPVDTFCYKKHQKLEEWEIKDENYKNKNFKGLFTFHILPINAIRESVKTFINDCKTYQSIKNYHFIQNCQSNELFQACEKMYIKFDKEHFKLLIPQKSKRIKATTSTIKIKGSSINSVESSSSKSNGKPKENTSNEATNNESNSKENTKEETKTTTKELTTTESSSGIGIIIIIVIIVIILVLFISFLIWLFVFKRNKKEESNTRLISSKMYIPATNIAEGDYTSIKHKTYSGSASAKDVKTKKGHKTSRFAAGVTVPYTVIDRSKTK